MPWWAWLTVGIFIGGTGGFIAAAMLCVASAANDLDKKIRDMIQ